MKEDDALPILKNQTLSKSFNEVITMELGILYHKEGERRSGEEEGEKKTLCGGLYRREQVGKKGFC